MITTVKNITQEGTWNTSDGTLFYNQKVELDNGETVQANSKTETPPYGIGDTVEVQITRTTKYGKQAKVKKFDGSSTTPLSGKNNDQIGRLACIKASAEFYAQRTASVSTVIATAEMFFKYSQNGELPNSDKIDVE